MDRPLASATVLSLSSSETVTSVTTRLRRAVLAALRDRPSRRPVVAFFEVFSVTAGSQARLAGNANDYSLGCCMNREYQESAPPPFFQETALNESSR